MKLLPVFFAIFSCSLSAQNASGVTPEWDVRGNIVSLAASVKKIQPVLESARPDEWKAKGAPDAYASQLNSARVAIQHLEYSSDNLTRQPDRLTVALDVLFRMEAVDSLLLSLRDAMRKYQDSGLSDRMNAVLADLSTHEDKLRRHITDLAATDEEELRVMDQEAQRCRTSLTRQEPPKRSGRSIRR